MMSGVSVSDQQSTVPTFTSLEEECVYWKKQAAIYRSRLESLSLGILIKEEANCHTVNAEIHGTASATDDYGDHKILGVAANEKDVVKTPVTLPDPVSVEQQALDCQEPRGNSKCGKRFQCDKCAYSTLRPYDLRRHQKKHIVRAKRIKSKIAGKTNTNACFVKVKNVDTGKVVEAKIIGHVYKRGKESPNCKGPKHKRNMCTQLKNSTFSTNKRSTKRTITCSVENINVENTDEKCDKMKQEDVSDDNTDDTTTNGKMSAFVKSRPKHVRSRAEKPFECDQCSYSTLKSCHLNRLKLTHLKPEVKHLRHYKCAQCHYSSAYVSNLIKHIKLHKSADNITLFQCTWCDFLTETAEDFKGHLQKHSEQTSRYVCTKCEYTSSRRADIRKHQQIHSKNRDNSTLYQRQYKCARCHYSSAYVSNLIKHQKLHKSSDNITLFKCTRCDFSTENTEDFTCHLRDHPLQRRQHPCTECEYAAYRWHDLLRHKQSHENKRIRERNKRPYCCNLCDYTTGNLTSLTRHTFCHKTPVKCKACDFTTTDFTEYTMHRRAHKGKESLHKCDRCNYTSVHKNKLTRHKLKHTGQKPYLCEECGYSTTQPYLLVSHQRTHRERTAPVERDQCDVAGRPWSHVAAPRLYVCDTCGVVVSSASSLRKHQLAIHSTRD